MCIFHFQCPLHTSQSPIHIHTGASGAIFFLLYKHSNLFSSAIPSGDEYLNIVKYFLTFKMCESLSLLFVMVSDILLEYLKGKES